MANDTNPFALLIIDPQVPCPRRVLPFPTMPLLPPLLKLSFLLFQVDFHGGGSLAVPGADEDARRIQAFVEANLHRITNIYVTLDSHQVSTWAGVRGEDGGDLSACPSADVAAVLPHTSQRVHISHPLFWKDANGAAPAPFTPISHADVVGGKWVAADEALKEYAEEYTRQLEASSGKFQHIIWPEHCLIGSPGHCVVPPVLNGTCVI